MGAPTNPPQRNWPMMGWWPMFSSCWIHFARLSVESHRAMLQAKAERLCAFFSKQIQRDIDLSKTSLQKQMLGPQAQLQETGNQNCKNIPSSWLPSSQFLDQIYQIKRRNVLTSPTWSRLLHLRKARSLNTVCPLHSIQRLYYVLMTHNDTTQVRSPHKLTNV